MIQYSIHFYFSEYTIHTHDPDIIMSEQYRTTGVVPWSKIYRQNKVAIFQA